MTQMRLNLWLPIATVNEQMTKGRHEYYPNTKTLIAARFELLLKSIIAVCGVPSLAADAAQGLHEPVDAAIGDAGEGAAGAAAASPISRRERRNQGRAAAAAAGVCHGKLFEYLTASPWDVSFYLDDGHGGEIIKEARATGGPRSRRAFVHENKVYQLVFFNDDGKCFFELDLGHPGGNEQVHGHALVPGILDHDGTHISLFEIPWFLQCYPYAENGPVPQVVSEESEKWDHVTVVVPRPATPPF